MSSFERALSLFESGQLSHEELLSELDRQLAAKNTPPVALRDLLETRQLTQPLPGDVHQSVLNRIAKWPDDPTVITGSSEARQPRTGGVTSGDVLQGRFSLVDLIGEGGMSRVFKAIDLRRVEAGSADPYVAVKVLTEPFSEYFGSVAALQREAQSLQSLAHPNIVRVMDCDRDGQTVFMTMEYLAGESLQRRLQTTEPRGVPGSAGESVVIAVANALEYAHGNHIVHGDLKPGNIIITAQGAVKVIDFGMARFLARPESGEIPKAVTPQYASPQMLAAQDAKPTDDVYALACIAYEVMSGQLPFGRRGQPDARDLRRPPPRPPGMPAYQYAALVKALAYDQQARTQSARQFLAEFTGQRHKPPPKYWLRIGIAVAAAALGVLYFFQPLHGTKPLQHAGATMPPPGTVIRDCPTCPLMTVLPAGHFVQGADAGDSEQLPFESPQHPVTIARPLAMSSNEVTVAEYREFVTATQRPMSGCNTYDGQWRYQAAADWQAPGFAQSPTHPVTCISWNDAVAYAAWLSNKSGHAYRLPSASEWEYAARAGTGSAQPWSKDAAGACAYANVADAAAARSFPGWNAFPCNDGYVGTAPVGSFKANAFGLNDLLGNAFEWVEDCWHADYVGAPTDGTARMDGDCQEHELRGGSWFSSPRFVNAAYRNRFDAEYRSSSVGFRLVREVGG